MKVNPGEDRLLVKVQKAETVSKGGIIMVQSSTSNVKTNLGTVVAVGKNRMMECGEAKEIPYKVGQIIMYDTYAGIPVKIGGVDYILILSDDCVADVIFEESDDLALI